MLDKLTIENFRSLKDVTLESLGKINVLVGPGNSGKTSFLEAVFLACGTGDASLLHRVLGLRKVEFDALHPDDVIRLIDYAWTIGTGCKHCLFGTRWNGQIRRVKYRRDDTGDDIPLRTQEQYLSNDSDEVLKNARAIFHAVTDVDASSYSGTLVVTPTRVTHKRDGEVANIPVRWVGLIQDSSGGDLPWQWSKVEESGLQGEVLELIHFLDQDVETISVASNESGRAYLTLRHSTLGRLPLEMVGAGFGKAVAIALYVLAGKGGVLLIDEIDASLHVGAQRHLVEFLFRAAQEHDVQLFISTHSLETLDVLLESFNASSQLWSKPSDLQVLQFSRCNDQTKIRAHSAEDATEMRDSLGIDLRR